MGVRLDAERAGAVRRRRAVLGPAGHGPGAGAPRCCRTGASSRSRRASRPRTLSSKMSVIFLAQPGRLEGKVA
jgi:hypothetical protein